MDIKFRVLLHLEIPKFILLKIIIIREEGDMIFIFVTKLFHRRNDHVARIMNR